MPISRVPELITRATLACEALIPGIRAVPFGHLGDGNIHFNLEQPVDWRGGAELDTMRRIKAALDPLGLMNPGKLLPS